MPEPLLKDELIGLVPAGGQAKRISPLPCSKELYPIGFQRIGDTQDLRPKVISHYLLEKMRSAGVSKVYVVLRPGKWDIPAYFGDGSMLDMHMAYLMLGAPFGVPFTLDQAYPFVRHATVAFGFPDIHFESADGFVRLLDRQSASHADVTLGLFAATHAVSKEDRVEFKNNGDVVDIILGPRESRLRYSWAIALWKPRFTQFLHDYVRDHRTPEVQNLELSAGHAIGAAIKAGLRVDSVILSERPYLDIGTPKDLYKAVKAEM